MGKLPIMFNTFDKCHAVVSTLERADKDVINALLAKLKQAVDSPLGSIVMLSNRSKRISESTALFFYHCAYKLCTKKIGKKLLYIPIAEVIERKLKIDDCAILILANIESVDKWQLRKILYNLDKFQTNGGICFIPVSLTREEFNAAFEIVCTSYFFSSNIHLFNMISK